MKIVTLTIAQATPSWMNGGMGKFIIGGITLAITTAVGAWLYSNVEKLRKAEKKDEKMDALLWVIISGVCVAFMFALLVYLGVQAFTPNALPQALPSQ